MAEQDVAEVQPDEEHPELNPDELIEALAPEEEAETQPTPQGPTQDDDDVPEKYRGKSMKEVIAMHQNAEKALGRQSGETGELREIVDNFIRQQTAQASTSTQPQQAQEAPDFYEDPEAAVSHAVENHPAVVEAQKTTEQLRRQSASSMLQQKHPDAKQIIGDPEFVEFIKASPIRQELFVRADTQADFNAADELITQFKARKSVAQSTADADREDRRAQLKAASTGTAKASTATRGEKIYRRADIIRLMREKPDRYEALAPEIQRAYEEGRVR